jgi:hypothetical protein
MGLWETLGFPVFRFPGEIAFTANSTGHHSKLIDELDRVRELRKASEDTNP